MAWVLRRFADRIVAVSDHARSFYLDRLRLPPDRVVTIPNGVDTTGLTPGPGVGAAVRKALQIPLGATVMCTVAVLRSPKGVQDALEALAHLAPRWPSLRYLVVGDGPHRDSLERLTGCLGLSDRVTFTGNRADIGRMLAAADLFLLPSHTEALPTAIAEAMAAGLPVVATSVGGIPEMVSSTTGSLVPARRPASLAAAIGDLLSDPARMAALGAAAAREARLRFDIGCQAERLAAEYRRLTVPKPERNR